jgi:hypothetical protein
MSRSIDRSSTRTLPLSSPAERAASARGGTSPPSGRSSCGKPEPPPGRRQTRGDPPKAFRNQTPDKHPPGFLPDGNAFPWSARGSPPGFPERWGPSLGHGPPGRFFLPMEVRRRSHGPPRQARGDPSPWSPSTRGSSFLSTCGPRSGPGLFAGTSNHEDSPLLRGATDPPGSKTASSVNCWPPPWSGPPGRAPPIRWRARAGPSPPRRQRTRRRGPPGPTRVTHSSLSAGRWRERIPDARPETERSYAARKPKPKSRKITPWL